VDAAVGGVIGEGGRVDVLIHNAGHIVFGAAEAFTPEQLAQLYDVNVLSTQRVNRGPPQAMTSTSGRSQTMSFVTAKDGTEIFYKDWGPKNAQPIVFHHGWPLSADDWDTQMLYFVGQATGSSLMTAAATAGRARSATVTTSTTTPPTSLPWSSIST
jgi:NAD(P)-dependent dehydrogenase (short-subunit alcohol dehydrogenase family)